MNSDPLTALHDTTWKLRELRDSRHSANLQWMSWNYWAEKQGKKYDDWLESHAMKASEVRARKPVTKNFIREWKMGAHYYLTRYRLDDEIQDMKDAQEDAFAACVEQGYTREEMAVAYGTSVNTLNMALRDTLWWKQIYKNS